MRGGRTLHSISRTEAGKRGGSTVSRSGRSGTGSSGRLRVSSGRSVCSGLGSGSGNLTNGVHSGGAREATTATEELLNLRDLRTSLLIDLVVKNLGLLVSLRKQLRNDLINLGLELQVKGRKTEGKENAKKNESFEAEETEEDIGGVEKAGKLQAVERLASVDESLNAVSNTTNAVSEVVGQILNERVAEGEEARGSVVENQTLALAADGTGTPLNNGEETNNSGEDLQEEAKREGTAQNQKDSKSLCQERTSLIWVLPRQDVRDLEAREMRLLLSRKRSAGAGDRSSWCRHLKGVLCD